ncbi:MAG TPA: tetratricopeptide repeat protein [Sedimentisphaerales bacterium]|nr:tetratricopeptide repeat protein [Sedimentisphaerales bacterium]
MLPDGYDMDDHGFESWNDAERKAHKAWELFETGDAPRALKALCSALSQNPTNASWHFDKALTLDALEHYEEAIREYKIAMEFSPNDVEILNCLAVDYTRLRLYDLAMDTFERIHQLDPNFEPAYCNSIITAAEAGNHEQAEQVFYLAQQINPDCPMCFYNIGNSLFVRGEYKRAIWCWQRTASLDQNHPEINYRIAQGCWASGHFEQARRHFLAELRRNPGCMPAIFDLGLLLLEIGEIESATEKFHRVLEFQPDFAPALHYLGEIHLNGGRLEEAVRHFTSSLEKDGSLCGPRFRLAQCAAAAGCRAEAIRFLKEELAMEPKDPDALVAMASLFEQLGEDEIAMGCLLQIDAEERSAAAWHRIGLLFARKGNMTEAVCCLNRSLEMDSTAVETLKHLAQVYLMVGEVGPARQLLATAKILAPRDKEVKILAGAAWLRHIGGKADKPPR